MRTVAISLFFFLCLSNTLFAQLETRSSIFVYKITDEQAGEIFKEKLSTGYQWKETNYFEKYCYHLVDSFRYKVEADSQKLDFGYYLFVNVVNENLQVELKGFHNISARQIEDKEEMIFQVFDSSYQILKDAKLYLDGEEIDFDEATVTFREKLEKKKNSIVSIKVHGQTLYYYYDATKIKKGHYYRRFSWRNFKYRIIRPFTYNGFFNQVFQKMTSKMVWQKREGYIAVNQPKYRHGDTVRVKAYITKPNGKPINDDMEVLLYDVNIGNYNIKWQKPIAKATVKHDLEGNFKHEFVLGDSLKLDKPYYIYFFKKTDKRRKKAYFMQSFQLEDYQLDKVDYTFSALKKEFNPQEKIILKASAKDQNNNYIPDGTIKLTVKNRGVLRYYEDSVWVADQLWTATLDLKHDNETQIMVPWDKIPAVKIDVEVLAEMYNSSGEYHKFTEILTLDNKSEVLKVRQDGEFIVAEWMKDNKSIAGKTRIKRYAGNSSDEGRLVELPYKEKINPSYSKYTFQTKHDYIEFSEIEHNISWGGKNEADSIIIQMQNPFGLPVAYEIYKLDKLLESGKTEGQNFIFGRENKSGITYTVLYTYFWKGNYTTEKREFVRYKDVLNIVIDQPQMVLPSQNVPVAIKVTDKSNKPVASVNLTAMAINTAFGNTAHYTPPTVKSPNRMTNKKAKYRSNLTTIPKEMFSSKYHSGWYEKFGLQKHLYYRVRFPENGVLMEYSKADQDTFYLNYAQFAPFIVKNGTMQPISMIYVNNRIVYYEGAYQSRPYSFVGAPGYNKIKIRTGEYEYEVDSVFLRKGEKLELSIDELHYIRHEKSKHIQRTKVDIWLSESEKNVIQNNYFRILNPTHNPTFLWIPSQEIHTVGNGTNPLVGPFPQNSTINLVVKDEYKRSLYFEPKFNYSIEEKRERLYEDKEFRSENMVYALKSNVAQPKAGELMHLPSIIKTHTPYTFADYLNDYLLYNRSNIVNRNAKYKKEYKNTQNVIAVIWMQKDSVVDLTTYQHTYYMPAGEYRILVFRADSTYFERHILLKRDSILYEKMDVASLLKVDSNFTLLKSMLKAYKPNFQPKKQEVTKVKATKHNYGYSFSTGNTLTGRLTDGNTGEGLIGAFILVEGTSIGTSTDIDGYFKMDVPELPVRLIFSYTGYNSKNILVNSYDAINVVLEEGVSVQEVVVTGYSTSKKIVKNKDEVYEGDKYMNQLEGKAPGVLLNESVTKVRGTVSDNSSGTLDMVSNGVTQEEAFLSQELSGLQIRSEFKDYAYWQPSLLTDQNGEAHFNIKFPDNITQWNTTVLGMDRNARIGFSKMQTKAFKPVMGQLEIPRFLIEGDKVDIVGKSINFTNDSFQVNTQFKLNGEIIQSKDGLLKNAIIEKTKINAPAPTDSLKLTYLMQTEKFGDGEERSIPVFRIGVEESKGHFMVLNNDTTIQWSFNELDTDIQLTAQSNILHLLVEDVESLKNYPYDCNEQTASRMIALLWDETIKNKLGEPVNHKDKINKTINRLVDTQNADGSYGWWKNGSANHWMTNYVLKALHFAATRGYAKANAPLQKGLVYVTNVSVYDKWNDLQKLETVHLLSSVQQNGNYPKLIEPWDTMKTIPSLYHQMLLISIKQAANLPYDISLLDAAMKRTLFGGAFWGMDTYRWYDSNINLTLLAYEIYKKAGKKAICADIRQYIMEQRRHYGWNNTFETAKILHTILPDILEGENGLRDNQLSINGGSAITIKNSPYQANLGRVKELTIKKTGNTPLFLTAYQTFHNANPAPKNDIFEVNTVLQQNDKMLKDKSIVLQQNQPVKLLVSVTVKQSADYVMIEVPIPAGCSYGEKKQSYMGYEVHREYFKNKTSIFCERLPIGTYIFEIELEPRYTGEFTLNAAKAEQMYFPVFYGRNSTKTVEIKN
jgi:alpha-2-macroglobulin